MTVYVHICSLLAMLMDRITRNEVHRVHSITRDTRRSGFNGTIHELETRVFFLTHIFNSTLEYFIQCRKTVDLSSNEFQ